MEGMSDIPAKSNTGSPQIPENQTARSTAPPRVGAGTGTGRWLWGCWTYQHPAGAAAVGVRLTGGAGVAAGRRMAMRVMEFN